MLCREVFLQQNPKCCLNWCNVQHGSYPTVIKTQLLFHVSTLVFHLVLNEMCLTFWGGHKSQSSELGKTTVSTSWRQMFSLYLSPLLLYLSLFCLQTVIIATVGVFKANCQDRDETTSRAFQAAWFFNLKHFYINTVMSLCQAWRMTMHRRIKGYFHPCLWAFFGPCAHVQKYDKIHLKAHKHRHKIHMHSQADTHTNTHTHL